MGLFLAAGSFENDRNIYVNKNLEFFYSQNPMKSDLNVRQPY
jgi:hypothetical protein